MALKAMEGTPTDLHHSTGKILRATTVVIAGRVVVLCSSNGHGAPNSLDKLIR